MHWNDTTSFFAFSFAADLIYTQFSEIRRPYASSLVKTSNELSKLIANANVLETNKRNSMRLKPGKGFKIGYSPFGFPTWLNRSSHYSERERDFKLERSRIERLALLEDRYIYIAGLISAIFSSVLLFYGTLHAGHRLSASWFWLLAILATYPLAVMSVVNCHISWKLHFLRRAITGTAEEVSKLVCELKGLNKRRKPSMLPEIGGDIGPEEPERLSPDPAQD